MFNLVALAVFLGTGTGDPPIDTRTRQDYSHLRMPAHGTVYKGMLYGFFDDDWGYNKKNGADLNGIPLEKIAQKNWKNYPFLTGGKNFRHHVGYGALWFSSCDAFLNRWDFDQIPELLANRFGRSNSFGGDLLEPGIFLLKLKEKYNKLAAWDSVPISENSCKTFILAKKTKKFEAWDTRQVGSDAKKKPVKSIAEVQNHEAFDSEFAEDFYALIRKNDYYFITESGKLYLAAPPKDGEKSRTMKALWDDANRPIVAVIEDADNNRVWLFTKNKDKLETQAVFFEMAAEIRQEKFDHAKIAPVNVEGRARPLLEYLPLIRDKAKKQQQK